MYKQNKKQIEEMFHILLWANDEIKKAIEKRQFESALDILEQCQDAAIQLGTSIEECEGEGFVTVSYVEEFCEEIYQIHEAIMENGFADAISTHKKISKSLSKIEQSIRNDIPVKKIAIFLPYKASMWDSLESVWKAADADPDCDAIVMPIPYYDKNPDGSFADMHYEGEQFPDYVPITDYQNYDFAKRRPDMIFIHNPYDECNRVTSVHPFFYSGKLKNLTDQLVYIPYFVLEEIDPKNKMAIQGMRHFCTLPGVANSHLVIVQSEKMRQVYIDVLTEWAGEETRAVWEKKILGLGSPKFDRVLDDSIDIQMPEEWKKILYKADGTKKKVILYNTGLVSMLEHKEAMLDKIENVLQTFREKQDDIALLWRPHPLKIATIKSMRTELWERYEKIITLYREDGWGIYDDTTDLERAIKLCDAYYGDPSSVIQLCKKAMVPVMVQNVDVKDNVK